MDTIEVFSKIPILTRIYDVLLHLDFSNTNKNIIDKTLDCP